MRLCGTPWVMTPWVTPWAASALVDWMLGFNRKTLAPRPQRAFRAAKIGCHPPFPVALSQCRVQRRPDESGRQLRRRNFLTNPVSKPPDMPSKRR
jgi:hypothetical protein